MGLPVDATVDSWPKRLPRSLFARFVWVATGCGPVPDKEPPAGISPRRGSEAERAPTLGRRSARGIRQSGQDGGDDVHHRCRSARDQPRDRGGERRDDRPASLSYLDAMQSRGARRQVTIEVRNPASGSERRKFRGSRDDRGGQTVTTGLRGAKKAGSLAFAACAVLFAGGALVSATSAFAAPARTGTSVVSRVHGRAATAVVVSDVGLRISLKVSPRRVAPGATVDFDRVRLP
jgi:hypothetical protein